WKKIPLRAVTRTYTENSTIGNGNLCLLNLILLCVMSEKIMEATRPGIYPDMKGSEFGYHDDQRKQCNSGKRHDADILHVHSSDKHQQQTRCEKNCGGRKIGWCNQSAYNQYRQHHRKKPCFEIFDVALIFCQYTCCVHDERKLREIRSLK